MNHQEAPYAGLLQHLSNNSNSNEARLKLLERRLTGELPSPRSLTFDGHLQQSDLEDISSSRLFRLPANDHTSDSEGKGTTSGAQRSAKKRKVSPDSDQKDQGRQYPTASPPFRQVTNRVHVTSPVAKHSPHRKSPALTSPLSARLLQRNTINKYFSQRGDNSNVSCQPVSICTQTHASLQEQEQTMQNNLLSAFQKAEDAQ